VGQRKADEGIKDNENISPQEIKRGEETRT
jgi:hypothetical protein